MATKKTTAPTARFAGMDALKPCEDRKRVRVAGPFTVDSLNPHRTLAMDIDDGLVDGVRQPKADYEAKSEIDAEAWATLNSDVSRPFDKPKTGRIAVKVINHPGDAVMKVFRVS